MTSPHASTSSCPSRFSLAQLASADLRPDEREALELHLRGCERCKQALASLRQTIQQYDEDVDAHWALLRARLLEEPVRRRDRSRWSPLKWLTAVAVPAAAVAAVLLVIAVRTGDDGPPEIGFKGTLATEVVAKRGNGQFAVKPGARLRPDDALRFVVTVSSAGFISVFSIDARGTAAPFYPQMDPTRDHAPLRLNRAGQHILPGSIVLDASAGKEHLVVLFSPHSFDRNAMHHKVAGLLREVGPRRVTAKRVGAAVSVLTVTKVGGGDL